MRGIAMTIIATDKKPEATFAFAAFLAFLSMLGPFSVDAYLPAFPDLAAEFGASSAHVQQTLTAYFVPFAVMNLLHGTLSDALGRRRALVAALAVYTLASLGCMFAENIGTLLLFRAMQGASAGAGVIALYAITGDCFEVQPRNE
jgi:DHA1 family bicyclomycin/chloramphenicol resistance-like MFS transporter